jgi:hypothetical protein
MFFLKRNLPVWERITRIAMAIIVVWAVHAGLTAGLVSWLAWASAATLILTAFVGFCPACAMVGRRYLDE